MLQATVERNMESFAGRSWKRGDIIPSEIIEKASPAAINALVSQKAITMSEDGDVGGPTSVDQQLMLARIEGLEETVEKQGEEIANLTARVDVLTRTKKTAN